MPSGKSTEPPQKTTVRIPPNLVQLVEAKARREFRSFNSAVCLALRLWVEGEIGEG